MNASSGTFHRTGKETAPPTGRRHWSMSLNSVSRKLKRVILPDVTEAVRVDRHDVENLMLDKLILRTEELVEKVYVVDEIRVDPLMESFSVRIPEPVGIGSNVSQAVSS